MEFKGNVFDVDVDEKVDVWDDEVLGVRRGSLYTPILRTKEISLLSRQESVVITMNPIAIVIPFCSLGTKIR